MVDKKDIDFSFSFESALDPQEGDLFVFWAGDEVFYEDKNSDIFIYLGKGYFTGRAHFWSVRDQEVCYSSVECVYKFKESH